MDASEDRDLGAESALYHELASRLDLIANRGMLEAVQALYSGRADALFAPV